MSQLNFKVPLKHPQAHTVLPSSLCPVRPVSEHANQKYHPPEEKEQKSTAHFSQFLSVIHAQLGRSPTARSTISYVAPSPVLNPKPCGTSSWPTSKSPFTSFLPTWSHIALPVIVSQPPFSLSPSLEPPP